MSKEQTILTRVPQMHLRDRAQWRMAYVQWCFDDATYGYVALCCAPVLNVSESLLREMAELILRSYATLYHGITTLPMDAVMVHTVSRYGEPDTPDSPVQVSSLAEFQRLHPLEYAAFYFDFPFTERLVVAYEVIGAHTEDDVRTFADMVAQIRRVSEQTIQESQNGK